MSKNKYSAKQINIISLLCNIYFLTACSHGVFSIPPASIKYFENQDGTGQAVRMETWGVAIDTNMDAGVSMGHVVKTYYYEGESSQENAEKFEKNNYQLKQIPKSDNKKSDETSPYAYGVVGKGLMLNTNANRTGIVIGVSAYERIYLPLEFDGVLYINSQLGSKKPGEFYIMRSGEPR